ncbi:MAG: DUF3467 domain-containing protein [Methermicoccaceae archaeon]
MSKGQPQKPGEPRINRSRAPDYKTVFLGGVHGGHRPEHFEMVVKSITLNANESEEEGITVLDMVDEVCIIMTPGEAKRTMLWLKDHVERWERQFGEIKQVPEEKLNIPDTGMYG